jgi:cytoskeletal protein RodZ
MVFVAKRVYAVHAVGPDLQEAREHLGWSREDVASQLKVPTSVIIAWEEDRWDWTDPVHVERMLRSYVRLLGAPEAFFLTKFQAQKEMHQKEALTGFHVAQRPRGRDLFVTARTMTVSVVILFALGLGLYVYGQVAAITEAPPLTISSPQDGLTVSIPLVQIVGSTAPETLLTVNGASAVVRPDGSFQLDLGLARGTTEIFIVAQKRHGKSTTALRRVV